MTNVNVVVGRLDSNKRIEVDEQSTIQSAMDVAGFTATTNEVIQDIENNEYDGDEIVEGGKGYFLVQRVKSGC